LATIELDAEFITIGFPLGARDARSICLCLTFDK